MWSANCDRFEWGLRVRRPDLEAKGADPSAIVLAEDSNDLLALWHLKIAPFSLFRVLALEVLLHNDAAVLVEETHSVDLEFIWVLKQSDSSNRLLLVHIDAGEACRLRRLHHRDAAHARGVVELKILEFLACLVAETVKLYRLLERQLLELLPGWPVEFDTHFHSNCCNFVHHRLPLLALLKRVRGLIFEHGFDKRVTAEGCGAELFLRNV